MLFLYPNLSNEVVTLNENNLIPNSQRSPSEVRANGAKGGKKSGETRRRKKSMREKMKMLLELPCADNDRAKLEAMGVSPEYMDNEMVLVMAQWLKAANGDKDAYDRVMSLMNRDIKHEELALKKRELKLKENAVKSSNPETAEEPMLYKALEEDTE